MSRIRSSEFGEKYARTAEGSAFRFEFLSHEISARLILSSQRALGA